MLDHPTAAACAVTAGSESRTELYAFEKWCAQQSLGRDPTGVAVLAANIQENVIPFSRITPDVLSQARTCCRVCHFPTVPERLVQAMPPATGLSTPPAH